jgi:type IV secretory pathway VirD2 relaxase
LTGDDDFRVRPGRIRAASGSAVDTALRQVRIAVARAGGPSRGQGVGKGGARPSAFGRGRAALVRGLDAGGSRRHVVVKARVVRRSAGGLAAHIGYLQRDGVTRDGEAGRLFDARSDAADASAFAERATDDRHHFRFIVSPEDAGELADLRAYARDLMSDVQRDLGAPLDWVAVDHWNTAHPHIHIILRGRLEGGADLVISRDYISQGFRARAEALAELELGPPSPRERAAALARDAEAPRWTRLDQTLERLADADRQVDLRPAGASGDPVGTGPLVHRLRTLGRLGLAEPVGPGRWRIQHELGERLRGIARETEAARRLEAAVKARKLARAPEQWATSDLSAVVIGRVLARGQDDELRGTGFAVIDGLDGRVHHITLADAGAPEPRVDAIVRASPPSRGAHPMTITVSDLDLADQIGARGATWLDRRALDPNSLPEAGGFADEVAAACEARIDRLAAEGLAERRGGGVRFAPGLLETLKAREVGAAAEQTRDETGLVFRPTAEGDAISGVYRRRLDLASGRFAMIDDGTGFSLVPWRPPLEPNLGRSVSGLVGARGEVEWRPPRTPGR